MILKKSLLVSALVFSSVSAFASMTISGTRIVFPGSEKEIAIRTNNKGKLPALVQVWVDNGNANADLDKTEVPFILTPPVYRVEAGKGQSVRMIYNGMVLPQDKESLFWFNMLEIPPEKTDADDGGYRLELAFRTRIKIFYRPVSLAKSHVEAKFHQLKWHVVDDASKGFGIKVSNPTPHYYSFDSLSVVSQGEKIEMQIDMVPPQTDGVFYPKKKMTHSAGAISSLDLGFINDYGAVIRKKMLNNDGKGFVIDNK